MATQQQDLLELEKKLINRQEKLEQKLEQLEHDKEVFEKQKEEYKNKLEKLSGLTRDGAKEELLRETEKDSAQMVARIIKEGEEEAKRTADKKGKEILVESIR